MHHVRNIGRPGIASMAISAVDNALWDLKARLLGSAAGDVARAVRDAMPIYGSGGFTSYQRQACRNNSAAGWSREFRA